MSGWFFSLGLQACMFQGQENISNKLFYSDDLWKFLPVIGDSEGSCYSFLKKCSYGTIFKAIHLDSLKPGHPHHHQRPIL